MANFHDWPERSLSYSSRCFDNLDSGEDYLDVLPVHSIGFLNFTLFDDAPEFFATYQLRNNKNNRLYTGKFSIHVIDLTRIDLATEEDKYYEIDRWAKLFKAATWEELKMIAKNDPDLMQASDELYKVNKNDILRQQSVNFKTIINKTTESRSTAAVFYPSYAERERYFRRNILYATEMRPWQIIEAIAEII